MRRRKRCRNKECGDYFLPCAQVPHQEYCSKPECQRARKHEWNRRKLASDGDYRENRRAAQRRWAKKNSGYWREYRQRHKDSADRNRRDQGPRDLRRKLVSLCSRIAKTDECRAKNIVLTGRYKLVPIRGDTITKTDESIIEMIAISA